MELLQIIEWISGVIVLFLALREVLLWYWKINRVVDALESIAESLKALPAVQEQARRQNNQQRRSA